MTYSRKRFRAVVLACACVLALVGTLVGCAMDGSSQAPGSASAADTEAESAVAAEAEAAADALRIVSMKGPTSVGLASMMQQGQGSFTVVAAADEAAALLAQGEADIACVPANLAATLYAKTGGAIRAIDVNTLGVLYVVTADASVDSVEALAGRTVYMTGKGTVPEYTVRALLEACGLGEADVDIQFKSEPAEVAALLAADANAVGILPQPYATSVVMKVPGAQMTVDLTAAWADKLGGAHGSFVTGVTVARAEVIEQNPAAVEVFLARHAQSAAVAADDPTSIAQAVVDLGIIDSAAIAEQAIPRCNVVCLTAEDMKVALSGYLEKLFEVEPASVGGVLPDDEFYYLG